MKRTTYLPLLALLALAAPQPGRAESAAPQANAAAVPAQSGFEADRAAVAASDPRRMLTDRAYAAEMLVRMDRLAAAGSPAPNFNLAVDNLRLFALIALERPEEIRATVDRMLAERPTDADFYAAPWMAALSISDTGRALAVVETASRSVPGIGWSGLRESLDRDAVFALLRQFQTANDKPSRVRLAEALFRIGWPGPEAHETVDSIRLILINDRLEKGDRTAAADFAAGMTTPSNVAPLIVQRRFDPLFREGTDRLARLRQTLEQHDRHTAEQIAAAPGDTRRVLERAQFLRVLGRESEAFALLQPFTRDLPATATADDQGMWVINEAAYALLELGRKDEAVDLMRRLAALPVADHGYLISASINYGEVLWEAGRYADSLAHARLLERDFAQFASDYGDMWIYATIVCALASLDRAGEAAPTLERMRTGADSNPAALTRAYLCLNDMAAAETQMIHRLEAADPEDAVLALQDYALGDDSPQTDILLARLLALRERPAVRAALDRVGRVLTLPVARTYWGSF